MLSAVLTDVDGTITDHRRRINTRAVETIRVLVDHGIDVVLASGNTACFMDAVCRMVGTSGNYIAENGGVYRIGFGNEPVVIGDRSVSLAALETLEHYYREKGITLERYSFNYRFADVAFAKTVPTEEVRAVLKGQPVKVLDTGFALHLQEKGMNKGVAFLALAKDLGIPASEFLAVGDAMNDAEMLSHAGVGVAVANAQKELKETATMVTESKNGDGFVEAVERYFPISVKDNDQRR
ncbi:phosphoglycolate phosphatase (TIGR01487 family) [Methanolinea mesophila]|uniref:phosphoglycolate phosphatase n=1 Tax=Methanolinea mesophila TaxID=547055 RepID=UPI001AE21D96|nr:phosphoglycolate phosphatase (TIGR01487 family) [Methanolinea mesophila]